MSIIIAGERSGVGKTTVTLALLSYLRQHNLSVQSFKVGPDYIDPMFHHYVTGRPCRNLDPVLTSEIYVQTCFQQHRQTAECVLVEGVMGLFDGATEDVSRRKTEERQGKVGEGREQTEGSHRLNLPLRVMGGFGSTAHVAKLLNLPVLLVVDCSRMSQSIAALVHGYCSFDPDLQIAGLVLNRVGSDRHLDLLQTALAPLHLPILGILRRHDSITIPDRHLGLLPTAELPQLDGVIQELAQLAKDWFDWEALMPLLSQESGVRSQKSGVRREREEGSQESEVRSQRESELDLQEADVSFLSKAQCLVDPTPPRPHSLTPPPIHSAIRIAIAQDAAFSFYYADNLDLLEALGAELVFWSPLTDAALPENVQGLILGGGFPEMFAAGLSENVSARTAVQTAIAAGMPTYAECGGLMYLCEAILDFAGQAWEMVGVLPTTAIMGNRLTLGYRQVEAQQEGVIFTKGAIAWGHEFHRSHLTVEPDAPLFGVHGQKVEGKERIQESRVRSQEFKQDKKSRAMQEGWYFPNLHASYVHLHWGNTPELPNRFLKQCLKFQPTQHSIAVSSF